MTKPTLLLAEDDANLGNLLKEYLQAKEFEVAHATNGRDAFVLFKKQHIDICLLDVMMPAKDGYTLAKEIRAINSDVPIVFLTAKTMREDAIEGFNAGADDYIHKPFSMEELLLRIKAILRRVKNNETKALSQTEFTIGQYAFNHNAQLLTHNGKPQKLSTKESDLLKLLCVNMNDVLDRSFALNTVWQNDSYFSSRSMDVYIAKLRKLLAADPKVEIINVHSKGFKLLVQA
jgi:two-component system, OmpR family, response regulator